MGMRRTLVYVLAISSMVFAKTADQLKQEFAEFLGPGKYARIVWQKEDADGRKCNMAADGKSKICALDTRDGVVRDLIPMQSNRHYSSPTFTWDGKRVVCTEGFTNKIYVVDFDGKTPARVLLDGYNGDGRTWQSPDGSTHWAIATQFLNGAKGAKLYRVNIDNPNEKVELFTCTWADLGWAGATAWVSMSVDGKKAAGGFPNYNGMAYLNTITKQLTYFPGTADGCWPTISRDNKYEVLFTRDPNAHRDIVIIDTTGREVLRKNLGSSVLGGSGNYFEAHRWTMDRDYMTLFAYKPPMSTIGISNPRIVRISDLKWVGINDTATTSEGNADVFFYTDASEAIHGAAPRRADPRAGSPHRFYSCTGQRISLGKRTGVVLAAGHASCAILMPKLQPYRIESGRLFGSAD